MSRKKSNGRSNGHCHNGNGKCKPKKPPAKKSAKKKPPPKKPATRRPSGGRIGESAMIVRRNDTMLSTQSALDHDSDGRRRLGERIDNMGASHVAATATAASISSALAYGAIAKGLVRPMNSAVAQIAVGTAAAVIGHRGDHDHIMMAGAGIASAGVFSMANQLAVGGYEAIEKRAEKRKAEKNAAEKDDKNKKTRNARRLIVVSPNTIPVDDDFAHREAAGDTAADADNQAA